ncbi:sensor histidine kinase [Nonomuraea sp. NBC_01738]|uniref:sensor histidine kinase n=1 Tax=Nonomuraea sp. NBC_01738 TaxID=2976003 RepID=UPI002E113DAF|nr:sensor histidine kinase [Nonomuraea sp. NBC_01738]
MLPSSLAVMAALPLLAMGVLLTAAGGLGLVVVPRMMLILRRWAEWHRGRAARLLRVPVERLEPSRAGWREVWTSPQSRRDLRWTIQHFGVGLPSALAAVAVAGQVVNALFETPVWWLFPDDDPLRLMAVIPVRNWPMAIVLGVAQLVLGVALSRWAVPKLARLHARTCLAVLRPSAADQLAGKLAERVGELTESRSGVLDAHAAELRRIERDLHDGTQARLVAIAMRLAVAREALGDDTGFVARLVKEAHEGTEEAMTELRQVIRSVYPPILADRGLAGAVIAIAARAGLPVETDLTGLSPVPAAVETAAYFIVAESITNAAKHSGATRVSVRLAVAGTLRIEITDDGSGGIDETRGTGVAGIRLRAAALDGTVTVDSPAGGPTAITVELPCAS